jgi:V8-like Glu-specific endopeptidase
MTNVETRPTTPSGDAGGTSEAASPHEPVSNTSQGTAERSFAPATGALAEGASPGLEVVARRRSTRPPETAPTPATMTTRPLDAYWASFGTPDERARAHALALGAGPRNEVVIGTDDRVQVTANQAYPWRCICSLVMKAQNGTTWVGTGWLVGPRLLLTAGHCVYMHDEGGWAAEIEVIPGRSGNSHPFGSVVARDYRTVSGWTTSRDSNYDYGAILLPPERRFGDELGWFGFAVRSDEQLRAATLNLAGYPGDKPGTQWFHSRGVQSVNAFQITYEIDTMGGQSGAPVWELQPNGGRYGVAVHTVGSSLGNGGTRISQEVFDNVVAWLGLVP